jgi:hypothetical protein
MPFSGGGGCRGESDTSGPGRARAGAPPLPPKSRSPNGLRTGRETVPHRARGPNPEVQHGRTTTSPHHPRARTAARRQRELVRASIEQLRASDGWQAYLKARSRFRSYSFRNVLLIHLQHPSGERVAGFRAWLELSYCVNKGSTAIRI